MQIVARRQFLALAIGAIATAATPRPAEAMPAKFRKCETATQNGITYLLYRRAAIVTKCAARKSVTIPDSIRHKGQRYTVRNVWDGAIGSKTRRSECLFSELSPEAQEVAIAEAIAEETGERNWYASYTCNAEEEVWHTQPMSSRSSSPCTFTPTWAAAFAQRRARPTVTSATV